MTERDLGRTTIPRDPAGGPPPVSPSWPSGPERQIAAMHRAEAVEAGIRAGAVFVVSLLTATAAWLGQTGRWPAMGGTTAFAALLAAELYLPRRLTLFRRVLITGPRFGPPPEL